MALNKKQVEFWRNEMTMLDKLYQDRMTEWQKSIDLYNNKFDKRIRDLDASEMIKIPRFYPLVRQIIATVAFNYPRMYFTVEDDEGAGQEVSDIMERASSAFLRLAQVKPHVHQAIFDSLACGIGWLRIDYNPPGEDAIPPYVANDALAEDMAAVNRVAPGFVHVDPMTPPHHLGHARYIRERMWVPLKSLRDDKNIKNRNQIQSSTVGKPDEMAFGEAMMDAGGATDQEALRTAVDNGDFVLVDRIHDRMNRRLIMFADGVQDPIMDMEHPFAKVNFSMQSDMLGRPIMDDNGQPILDLSNPEPASGWVVENGFPFVPIKFDMSATSFYPVPHLKYIEDMQLGICESMSRQSALLKRTARQGLVSENEVLQNPNLLDNLRKGVDGEWHAVQDIGGFRELQYGAVPGEQYEFEDRLRAYEAQITQVNELTQEGGGESKTATEAGLLAASASINREWMESRVADAYESVVRNAFQVMGDPRYEPESFEVNVAPDGQERLTRALRSADFLWNYRIHVQTGSTRPLFEQLQLTKAIDFYDRARNSENFDAMELDKYLASAYEVADPEKLLKSDINAEAVRAVQLENDFIIRNLQDPGVAQGQDNRAHIETHPQIQELPQYQQLVQVSQQADVMGQPTPQAQQAGQTIQSISQIVQQHIQAHEQAEQQNQQYATGGPRPGNGGAPMGTLQEQVQENAAELSEQVRANTVEVMG